MNRLGVRGSDGKIRDAVTASDVGWRFEHKETRHGCRITTVETTVSVVYTLPRWLGRSIGSSALKARWDEFMTALRLHEEGHLDNAVEAPARVESAIATMGARRSCRELEKAANALGRSILDELRKKDADYDARTRHGKTQGATFP